MTKPTIADGLAMLGEQMAQQNKLLAALTPPTPMPPIGSRSDLTLTGGEWFVRHVPVLQLAFKTEVPDSYLELAPELARVTCPCGAVVEVEPATIEACHGPEGGECPRYYLYTGETVRVANVDALDKRPD